MPSKRFGFSWCMIWWPSIVFQTCKLVVQCTERVDGNLSIHSRNKSTHGGTPLGDVKLTIKIKSCLNTTSDSFGCSFNVFLRPTLVLLFIRLAQVHTVSNMYIYPYINVLCLEISLKSASISCPPNDSDSVDVWSDGLPSFSRHVNSSSNVPNVSTETCQYIVGINRLMEELRSAMWS